MLSNLLKKSFGPGMGIWPLLLSVVEICAAAEAISKVPAETTAARQGAGTDIRIANTDWPWWRGPQANGIADPAQNPPLQWSEGQNVVWQVDVPGRGHSSPTVVGDRVILTSADEQLETQSVLCYDRATGKRLWTTDVHRDKLDRKGNKKTTQASSSVACDGERLFVNFLNEGAVHTTALDLAGQILWTTRICDFVTHQGFGSSPALYRNLVIVSADNRGGGILAALDRQKGTIVWQNERPAKDNYTSPVVLSVGGKDQLLLSGCDLASAFDPLTGAKLWETDGATTECVTTMVSDGRLVFVSGGYPRNHTEAILADGSAKIEWQNNTRVYVPSMLVYQGYLYAVTDAGAAVCWKSDSGAEQWKARLGGTFDASLVLAGEHLFATNESGKTFVFKADPGKFELVAENQLGDEAFATPTICGSRIYLRVVKNSGGARQEVLYCLGKPQ
jgi:outer membrane protein assembly factor BamB